MMNGPGQAHDLALWIRLEQTAGVGPETARKLLNTFGVPENIFSAGVPSLRDVISERIAWAINAPLPEAIKTQIEKSISWANKPGNQILTLADTRYPRALLDIPDPPLILYVKGNLELLSQPSLGIVGSRNATTQGIINAEKFAEVLSRAGLTIVSGMAMGIDTAAHEGALRGAGSTVAVIGTGADIIYPARNRELAHCIAGNGCIVTEYAIGTPAIASNFPRRNRLISGLAKGVLVVEAAARSGSLITARMAAEQGREVFAIPGSIHSPLSKGCHLLIREGAKLVECAQDVLEEIQVNHGCSLNQGESGEAALGPPQSQESPLLCAVGYDPVAPELLAERSGQPIAEVSAQLLVLELQGLIEMLPGGLVRRVATQ